MVERLQEARWWRYEARDVLSLPAEDIDVFLKVFEDIQDELTEYRPAPFKLKALSRLSEP